MQVFSMFITLCPQKQLTLCLFHRPIEA
jgi:hypothetical protein